MIDNSRDHGIKITADLFLLHPPAYFDFRNEEKIYFPYLSTSGDVPITPVYEYFPLGLKTLRRFLGGRGYDVKIMNLGSLMLRYPKVDLNVLLKGITAKIIGIDLHWMIHVQGSLTVAALLKKIHPETLIMLGGISSTYYAEELIQYPFVDMVMRGYDTHEPMCTLLDKVKTDRSFSSVPNLIWKDSKGEIFDNGYTYTPTTFSCGIDWSTIPQQNTNDFFPILEVLSTQNAGCIHNCGWCGGSRDAFRRIHKCKHSIAHKDLKEIEYEFRTIKQIPGIDRYHFYSCGSYNESKERLEFFLDHVETTALKSVNYEQFYLTPDDILKKMAKANEKTCITLSPESHDLKVAKLAGRGVYSMDDMEKWIEKALDFGIREIDIWFFVGMPEQDEKSVFETVDYCNKLLKRFKDKRVVPLICPMIPFLDPGSNFFSNPEQSGYKTHFRTVEEHRRGMTNASLINRLNYETRWLSRDELVDVGYRAVRRLFEIKGDIGFLPASIVESILNKIDDAMDFIKVVHKIDCIMDEKERDTQLSAISGEIRRRNEEIFFSGVANQTFPVNRKIGGRWIDEIPFDLSLLEEYKI